MTDYLNPELAAGLSKVSMPIVQANSQTLEGYGKLVLESPESFPIEIVRWPAQGWRPVDEDSGNEGGTVEGTFLSEWRGEILYGQNEAVRGNYILGYACDPEIASEEKPGAPERILIWHGNYHPDGGQLFFPLEPKPFVVPLAKPGDDVSPEDFVCFYFEGLHGLYIHPDVWHDGVYTLDGRQRFYGKQGAVHARVSVNFAKEFGCLLEMPLQELPSSRLQPK